MEELIKHKEAIQKLCEQNKVKTLYVFGSASTDSLTMKSDIDLLVDIDEKDPHLYTDYYFDLKFKLEDLFKRPVDLLEERAIKNNILREELNKTKVSIYGE
jgi:uncharacterized protein